MYSFKLVLFGPTRWLTKGKVLFDFKNLKHTSPSDCLTSVITFCMSSDVVQYSPSIQRAARCILKFIHLF